MDDTALQDLAWQLGQEWGALGVNLGLKWAQIEHIKADNPMQMKTQIMDMLVTWRQGLGRDADPKQLLINGLDAVGRTDLAGKVATNDLIDSRNRTDWTDFDLRACRPELADHYLNNLCKVRMHPLIPSLVRDMGSIYTDLQMVKRTHLCMYEQSGNMPSECSSLEEDGTNTKDTQLNHQNLVSLDGRGRYRVLLTGKTGSGKSTILKKITHDWSNLATLVDVKPSNPEAECGISDSSLKPDSPLSKFTLLFTLKLNQMSKNPNLVDAIFDQILSRDTKISKLGLRSYIENHQDKVLFLLDGLDELPPNVLGKTESTDNLKDVLLCRALQHCCVIVTSKHHIANQFFKIYPFFARVETTGLGLRGREEYINKYFKNNQQTGANLISAVRSSVSLSSLSEIPLLLQMICLVWADKNSLPERLTDLYDNAVRILLMHRDGKKVDSLPSRSELPDGLLKRLGRVALEGLLDKEGTRLVFPVEDFQQGDAAKGCEIGLLLPEDKPRGLDVQSTVTFLHVSFQELCAATYLADLSKTNKKHFIRYISKLTKCTMINMEYLLRFCCGKSKKAARCILSHAKKLEKQHVLCRQNELQCLRLMLYLEARSKTLLRLLSDIVSFPFLGGEHLVAAHFFSQGKQSLPRIESLSVECTSPAEPNLVMTILHHTPNLETLLWFNGAMDSGEDEGSVAIPILTNLRTLSVHLLKPPLHCQCSLVPNFIYHQTNLSTIHLVDVDMHEKVSVFKTQSRVLESLRLKYCYLVSEDIEVLCRVLSDAKHLIVLDLSGNNLSGKLDLLVPIVPRLKELALAKCGLRDIDNESLVRMLSAPDNLRFLKLTQNTVPGLLDTVTSNAPGVQILQI